MINTVYDVKLVYRSYNTALLEKQVTRIIEANNILGVGSIHMVRPPTRIRKFTVLRSPHIDKKSREQFELRTKGRLLLFNNLVYSKIITLIAFCIHDVTPGIGGKVEILHKYNQKG